VGYGPDIDEALARMSTDNISELTTWNKINAFHVIARYYALSRFATLLSTRVDTEAYAIEGDRETIFDNIQALIDAANKEAMAYGYVLQVTSGSQIGDANQDVDQTGEGSTWKLDALQTNWAVDNIPYRYDYGEFL
jgi:hypothetical protein